MSVIEEFVLRVGGPEERVDVAEGAGAEVAEAACRLGAIVSIFGVGKRAVWFGSG